MDKKGPLKIIRIRSLMRGSFSPFVQLLINLKYSFFLLNLEKHTLEEY